MKNKILYFSNMINFDTGAGVHGRSFFYHAKEINPNIITYPEVTDQLIPVGKSAGKKHQSKLFLTFREVFVLGYSLFKTIRNMIFLRKVIKTVKIIVYRMQDIDWTCILLSKIIGIPVFLEVNSPLTIEKNKVKGQGYFKIYSFFEKQMIKASTHFFVVSSVLKKYLVSIGVKPKCITVNPNGVDIKQFSPMVDGNAVREELNCTENIVIGFSGTLMPWHDIDLVLNFLKKRDSVYKFLIIGDSPHLNEVRKWLEDQNLLSRVIFVGQVKHHQVPQYLAATDILLATYKKNTLFYFSPLKLLEYLAMGKPIVASNLGQVGVLMKKCNGYLIDPEDYDQFSNAIIEIAHNYEKISEEAQKNYTFIANNYTWYDNAHRVLTICDQFRAKGN